MYKDYCSHCNKWYEEEELEWVKISQPHNYWGVVVFEDLYEAKCPICGGLTSCEWYDEEDDDEDEEEN